MSSALPAEGITIFLRFLIRTYNARPLAFGKSTKGKGKKINLVVVVPESKLRRVNNVLFSLYLFIYLYLYKYISSGE